MVYSGVEDTGGLMIAKNDRTAFGGSAACA